METMSVTVFKSKLSQTIRNIKEGKPIQIEVVRGRRKEVVGYFNANLK
jgi:antitoxin (DNA-binding transcriptional repressor) of toxin-antitoxin stability system